jgi:hypothetical protein
MQDYLELKSELPKILEIVETFPDQLQERVFDILVARFLGTESAESSPTPATESPDPPVVAPAKETQPRRRKSIETFHILPNLNLHPDGSQSLVEFVKDKNPSDSQEFNAVFVYYLAKVMATAAITPDHVYTCYKATNQRVPTTLVATLRNTASRKGWIDPSDLKNIKITIGGENFVEHDLPRISTKKK